MPPLNIYIYIYTKTAHRENLIDKKMGDEEKGTCERLIAIGVC